MAESLAIAVGILLLVVWFAFLAGRKRTKPARQYGNPQLNVSYTETRPSGETRETHVHEVGDSLAAVVTVTRSPFTTPQERHDAWLADRRNEPATERQRAAVSELGLDMPNLTFGQAHLVLSIRNYVIALAKSMRSHRQADKLGKLVVELVSDPSCHKQIMEWSWKTKNDEVRKIPRDALRIRCESFLRDY